MFKLVKYQEKQRAIQDGGILLLLEATRVWPCVVLPKGDTLGDTTNKRDGIEMHNIVSIAKTRNIPSKDNQRHSFVSSPWHSQLTVLNNTGDTTIVALSGLTIYPGMTIKTTNMKYEFAHKKNLNSLSPIHI